ncbi:MAG: transposase [Elusimicrobia bacterium]|nr:transposase [Elusimicrobiota bacterium]
MTRGDGGRCLFEGKDDYGLFLQHLRKAKKRFGFKLYAYCLMPNHFHLLMRVSAISISVIMHWLQLVYAKRFNSRRNRWGHVFQDRFKAKLCGDDGYFLRLLRYIHRNPVRSGLVESPSQWPWSGHQELVGSQGAGPIDKEFPLSLYSDDQREAVRLYLESTSNDDSDDSDDILEATEFSIEPSTTDEEPRPALDWRQAAAEVSEWTRIGLPTLLGPSRERSASRARHVLIRRLLTGGMRPVDIAGALGCSPALISKACLDS